MSGLTYPARFNPIGEFQGPDGALCEAVAPAQSHRATAHPPRSYAKDLVVRYSGASASGSPVSLHGLRDVLARVNWDDVVDDNASIPRLRRIVQELFDIVSALPSESGHSTYRRQYAQTVNLESTAPTQAGAHCATSVTEIRVSPSHRGLAGWQIKRLTSHIDSNLGSPIKIHELAILVRLSSTYFSRVFRGSFGASPHRYVMRRRVERAQSLMLTTDVPLGQIAVDCGLADQAHFSRLFRKLVGDSPGAWRRARSAEFISRGASHPTGPSNMRI
jgi:AraC-like DNA-binding protein